MFMRNSIICVAYLCFPVALQTRIYATMHVSTCLMSLVFIAYVSSSYNSRYLFKIKAFSCCMSHCACGFQCLIMTTGITTYSWARVSAIVFSCVKEGSVAVKASKVLYYQIGFCHLFHPTIQLSTNATACDQLMHASESGLGLIVTNFHWSQNHNVMQRGSLIGSHCNWLKKCSPCYTSPLFFFFSDLSFLFCNYSSSPHHWSAAFTCLYNCFLPSASSDFFDSFLITHMDFFTIPLHSTKFLLLCHHSGLSQVSGI